MTRPTRLSLRAIAVLALLAGLMALPAQFITPVLAQDNPADQPVRPTIVETGRLKFLSSSGDVGGTVTHPDGTIRIWNFNPDTRALMFFDPGLGRRLWASRVPDNVNLESAIEQPMLIGGGQLLLFSARDKVVSFDGESGNFLWTFTNDTPNRPWTVGQCNALPDVVVLHRETVDPRFNRVSNVEIRVLDSRSGEARWQMSDENATAVPIIWRGFITHTCPNPESETGELHTRILDLRTGEEAYKCDFVPAEANDATMFTARFRKGLNRSRYLLPDADGKLREAELKFDPALGVKSPRLHIPAVNAPLATAMWIGSTNPEMAKRTFYVREEGHVAHLDLLPVPEDVDHQQAMILGNNLVTMFRDPNLQMVTQGIDLRTKTSNFILRPDQVKGETPEPAQWPTFGVRFSLVQAGSHVGWRVDLREERATTLRLLNPATGAVSGPRVVDDPRNLPFNLTGGEFGWIENDEIVVCTAGKEGKLTSEPKEGEAVPMARVLGLAQRWLVSNQNRDGYWVGQTMVPLFTDVMTLAERDADLGTTALAGIALCVKATDEFDEFGLHRRGAVRRAVRWVAMQQNEQGMFQKGYSNMIDHLMALEFMIRALPSNLNQTTQLHRTAISKALRFTINSRGRNNEFRLGLRLPAAFTIPQAPGLDGTQIQQTVNRQDTGFPVTMLVAHRAFKAGTEHPALRPLVQPEIEKNVAWATASLRQPGQMMAAIENLGLILAAFGKDLPQQFQPGPAVVEPVWNSVPRAIRTGHRGRVQGLWWYAVPELSDLYTSYGGAEAGELNANFEAWLYTSRFPDGRHSGTIGSAKATALAAIAAAGRDQR